MADSAYKVLGANDKVTTRTLLHEAIPITGTIVSGTYGTWPSDTNVKNFSHGMFQSVYDYPYLSSSANHIFDITVGVSAQSSLSITSQKSKKNNIYNQMAQVLVGYDVTGSVMEFDEDGDFVAGGRKIQEAIFINFSRLLTKDEIKKETFEMSVGTDADFLSTNGTNANSTNRLKVIDVSGSTEYRVNSPAGEYAVLYAMNEAQNINLQHVAIKDLTGDGSTTQADGIPCGLIYYQAGIVVLTASLFVTDNGANSTIGIIGDGFTDDLEWHEDGSSQYTIAETFESYEISSSADALRSRIANISFNNTTELNSTIYFCRANHNEFNYSSNPTYLTASQIRVKQETTDLPISYVTSVGLYSADNQLLAVGKLSEPLRKDPTIEYTLRARLDY
mgnify:CR=1 FL=1